MDHKAVWTFLRAAPVAMRISSMTYAGRPRWGKYCRPDARVDSFYCPTGTNKHSRRTSYYEKCVPTSTREGLCYILDGSQSHFERWLPMQGEAEDFLLHRRVVFFHLQ